MVDVNNFNSNLMFKYKERCQFNPSKHGPHIKTLKYIEKGSRILDIGCRSGYLGRELKKIDCNITGIEIDKDEAVKAREFYDSVIIADIECIDDSLLYNIQFDCIIFGDLLEHLKRPDLTLVKFRSYLKPTGFIIVSIPNIARLEYRLEHLFGNFDYEDDSILSKSHLRFFTLKTARQLIESSGYRIVDINYTGFASKIKIFPKMFAWQFIFKAIKK